MEVLLEQTSAETLAVLKSIDTNVGTFTSHKPSLRRPSRLDRMSNDELQDLVDGGRATTGDVKDLFRDGRLHVAASAIIQTAKRGRDGWINQRCILAVFCGLLRGFSPKDSEGRKIITSLARVIRQSSESGAFFHHPLNNIALYARHFGFLRAERVLRKL